MGFLSKLMKSPLMQFALPIGLSAAMPGIGSLLGSSSLFGAMNPMVANAAKQAMLGYGTAALTGSKHPGKAAMFAGLASMPFSYMDAASKAKNFNNALAGAEGMEATFDYLPNNINRVNPGMPPMQSTSFTEKFAGYQPTGETVDKISVFDILGGKTSGKNAINLPSFVDSATPGPYRVPNASVASGQVNPGTLTKPQTFDVTADIFTKPEMVGGKGIFGTGGVPTGQSVANFLPTIASQAAAMYGGRMTPEEEWEATKKKRNKELAFLYGIDEDQVKGEFQNPYYDGGGFFNQGGIASINYENGGPVNGPGGPKEDLIDAKLSDGEFVMTAKAVENFGGGSREAGAKKMYQMMNQLDPDSETVTESMGVYS